MPTQSYNDIERNAAANNIPLYAHVELTDEFKNAFDQLADLGTLYLSLTGGEIFLRPDFFELADYARHQGFALRLFTNATLITQEMARQIAHLRPLLIEISMYGITPTTHDAVTIVAGSLDDTLASLRYLCEHNIKLLLKTPTMSVNIHEVQAIREFAQSIGAEFRADAMISPKLNMSVTPLGYRLSDDDLRWFHKEIAPEWKPFTPKPDAPVCNAAKGVLAISPYGDVFPCLRVQQSAGNIRDTSLREIWKNAPVMRQMHELIFSKLQTCSACEKVAFCNPCPGLALLEHGDMSEAAQECCRQAESRKK
ncbi:SPASM domain-containing protein [candidate division KSB1 bacterium]|nr:SPASM domain-containing protein [candidate division KSB1 bacterium]